jgi:TolB-like protein
MILIADQRAFGMMSFDVFVSYPHQDKATAAATCAMLEASGIRCWIAPRDIVPGADWGESIIDAMTRAKVMVLIFSGHANGSAQIKREVERAVNKGIPIIPLRIENIAMSKSLEYFLSTQHWLDALTPPLEKHLNRLAASVRALLQIETEGDARPIDMPNLGQAAAAPLALPDKPSIAVLPFQNMSGDPEQEYFTDGMVEEIITGLSRIHWLFVIARNSTFTYKGRAVDVKQIGRELGVRYVLEGSVRKALQRVRITGQLIDASTGAHIWADRFDGTLADIFDLQDHVAAGVVGAISTKVEQIEIQRSKRKSTDNWSAYDYFLRGMAMVHELSRETNGEALQLFHRATELDSAFASAYGMAAWCYVLRKSNRWTNDRSHDVVEVSRLARNAVSLGKDDAVALSRGGYALAYVVGELEAGSAYVNQALMLSPNLAHALLANGWCKIWLGEPEAAIQQFTHVIRLSPVDLLMPSMHAGLASAHFFAGDYEKASLLAGRLLQEKPDFVVALRYAAASNALLGRLEEAQRAMGRLRKIDPLWRMSDVVDQVPLRRAEDMARYEDGLRKAGLPE